MEKGLEIGTGIFYIQEPAAKELQHTEGSPDRKDIIRKTFGAS